MIIRATGRRVVICGDGEQAAQKARLILKTDAVIVLAAPVLDPELEALAEAGRATHHAGRITPAVFEGAARGFIAMGCPGLDAALHGVAKAAGCPVNVVDRPDLCDLTTPSLVDRDPVVVATGTEGSAPVLARQIKTQVEQMLSPNLGGLAALAGRMCARGARAAPRLLALGVYRGTAQAVGARRGTRGVTGVEGRDCRGPRTRCGGVRVHRAGRRGTRTPGTCREGAPLPDCARHARPGTTLALYMSVAHSARIVAGLMARGMPGAPAVTVAARVTHPDEAPLRCRPDGLTATRAR